MTLLNNNMCLELAGRKWFTHGWFRPFWIIQVLILGYTFSQAQNAVKYSNEFLSIGVGARSLAMGKSVSASTGDVHSAYWNPAGLTQLKDNIQLGYMHSSYWSGVANYDYAGLAFKLKNESGLAVSMIRFGIDNIPNTFDLVRNGQIDFGRITSFSAVDYAFLLSYGHQTKTKGLSLGGNAKIIHRKAGPWGSAMGFGVDAGIRYHSEKEWYFSLMARDITTTFNAWSFSFSDKEKEILLQTNNEIPQNSIESTLPSFLLGMAKEFKISKDFGLLAETNWLITSDGRRNTLVSGDPFSIDPVLGCEANYRKLVFLRGGVGNLQKSALAGNGKTWMVEPNAGVGLKLKAFSLDYALSTIGKQATGNYTHVFSVIFSINKTEETK